MQYTELTRKELQREYTRMTQRYSSYMREPMELDMRAEDPAGTVREPAGCKAFRHGAG